MLDNLLNINILSLISMMIPLVFGMVVHEVSHGYTAYRLGDPTAKMLGRLTLNPLKHVDPIMSVGLPLFLYIASNGTMIFGGAKPIPVQVSNLRNPAKDMAWVALAGPLSNIAMAIMWMFYLAIFCVVLQLFLDTQEFYSLFSQSLSLREFNTADIAWQAFFLSVCIQGIIINLLLAIFNLLPIPPLDGSRVLVRFLPTDIAMIFYRLEPWGLLILIILIQLNFFSFLFKIIDFLGIPMINIATQ